LIEGRGKHDFTKATRNAAQPQGERRGDRIDCHKSGVGCRVWGAWGRDWGKGRDVDLARGKLSEAYQKGDSARKSQGAAASKEIMDTLWWREGPSEAHSANATFFQTHVQKAVQH
jgi:hypothetical protein